MFRSQGRMRTALAMQPIGQRHAAPAPLCGGVNSHQQRQWPKRPRRVSLAARKRASSAAADEPPPPPGGSTLPDTVQSAKQAATPPETSTSGAPDADDGTPQPQRGRSKQRKAAADNQPAGKKQRKQSGLFDFQDRRGADARKQQQDAQLGFGILESWVSEKKRQEARQQKDATAAPTQPQPQQADAQTAAGAEQPSVATGGSMAAAASAEPSRQATAAAADAAATTSEPAAAAAPAANAGPPQQATAAAADAAAAAPEPAMAEFAAAPQPAATELGQMPDLAQEKGGGSSPAAEAAATTNRTDATKAADADTAQAPAEPAAEWSAPGRPRRRQKVVRTSAEENDPWGDDALDKVEQDFKVIEVEIAKNAAVMKARADKAAAKAAQAQQSWQKRKETREAPEQRLSADTQAEQSPAIRQQRKQPQEQQQQPGQTSDCDLAEHVETTRHTTAEGRPLVLQQQRQTLAQGMRPKPDRKQAEEEAEQQPGKPWPRAFGNFPGRQRQIHYELMKKWRTLDRCEPDTLTPEQKVAIIRSNLCTALRKQQRLDRQRDDAAARDGCLPPSQDPWPSRVRTRTQEVRAEYTKQMERVALEATSIRMAEARSIPAVCTALAGMRLLHLDVENAAHDAGVSVPPELTLDAALQRQVADIASGLQQRDPSAVSLDLQPDPVSGPRTFREELSGFASMIGWGTKQRRQPQERDDEASGVRVVHETAAMAEENLFVDLLKQVCRDSEQYENSFDSWRATREMRRAARSADSGESSDDEDEGPAALAADRAVAPSVGSVFRSMFGLLRRQGSEDDSAASDQESQAAAIPSSSEVCTTSGGGVVYQGSPPETALPMLLAASPDNPRQKAMLAWKEGLLQAEVLPSFVPDRRRERELWELGYRRVAGIDDSGAGTPAGPIVAAACIMPLDVNIRGVKDSKALGPAEREALFAELTSHRKIAYATYVVDSFVVDEIGAVAANMVAMAGAFRNLAAACPDFALVDGRDLPKVVVVGLDSPSGCAQDPLYSDLAGCELSLAEALQRPDTVAMLHGDHTNYIIAAASIIATVSRERIMQGFGQQWPQYGFEKNHGFLDTQHKTALQADGPSPVHRAKFGAWSDPWARKRMDPTGVKVPAKFRHSSGRRSAE